MSMDLEFLRSFRIIFKEKVKEEVSMKYGNQWHSKAQYNASSYLVANYHLYVWCGFYQENTYIDVHGFEVLKELQNNFQEGQGV